MNPDLQEGLTTKTNDPLVKYLSLAVIWCVRILAILMVFIVFWAVLDVVYHMYINFFFNITSLFDVENLLSTLGAFLAVLIAVEVFLNIIFYLKEDAVHVPLVLATGLTAIARKVIILDYNVVSTDLMYATASLVLALGISYWLVTKKSETT